MIDEKYLQYTEDVLEGRTVAGEAIKLACQRFLSYLDRDDVVFDHEKADRVVNFCEKLTMDTGKFAGQKFRLTDWQKFVIYYVYGLVWKDSGLRITREVYLQLARKSGKALSLDTPIITPSGYTTMGDLKVGDTVFDEKGKPTTVTFVTPVMYNHKCYQITFSDGEVITADADHNWFVERYHKSPHVETTEEIVTKGYRKERSDGYTECYVSVPTAKPLEFSANDLPVDPYTFGIWLGDGSAKGSVLTLNGDDCNEILSYIPYTPTSVKKYDDENAFEVKLSNPRGKELSTFSKFLIDYNLRHNKHIPTEFLYTSVENRLALLQGIMDADGYLCEKGGCEITQKNDDVADGICFLLSSLGIKYNRRYKTPKINGKECNPVNRISFNTDKTLPVFRLKRKFNGLKDKKGKKNVKYIKEIREVESVPVKCITVDSPNHLYLCGWNNTVTHNTALASALALYHLAADGEGDAQGVFAANSAEQAQLAFRQATNYMSHLDPKKKYFQTYRSEIRFPLAKSSMKVVSADARRLDGLNLSFFVLDEYHAAQNSDVYNVLASSQGMRNQPMALIITTAGFDLTGPCFQLYQHCKEILHGKVEDDSTAAFIFELDEDDDYTDERVWSKAQPNLDITVTKDYIKKELTKCQISPTAQTNFLTKILNRWCQGEFGDWINADYVLKCLDPVDLKEYEGATCEVGLDLASVSDMAALTVLLDRGTHLVTKNYYFLPQTALKESSNAEKYHNWSRSKKLILTNGNVIDYDFILNKLQEIHRITPINTIWYDAWNSTALIIRLTELGFNCKPYSQSAGSINKPARELEKRVRECSILMDSNPITTWMFHNVTIKEDYNGNIKPVKVNANSENKIDGVVSILMAIGGWLSIPKFDYGI